MSRYRSDGCLGFAIASYPISQVHDRVRRCLPRQRLALFRNDGRVRWSPRLLVVTALLTAWQCASTLGERFTTAREAVTRMHPGRRRVGVTYRGFIGALCGQSSALLASLLPWWRQRAIEWSGMHGRVDDWTLFAVDGTKVNCPRSVANEQAFGCAGKAGSAPQLLLTMILHLGSWTPWSWRAGPGTDDERAHLLSMLSDLPRRALLLADALYTSYALLETLIDQQCAFIIRGGANLTLLRKLDFAIEEHDQIVYLWPNDRQRAGQPPLVLRMVHLQVERSRQMCLLTSVLDPNALSDEQVARHYAQRWGIEVTNRTLKKTLGRATLQSQSPDHARAELDWNVAALTVLALINLQVAAETGVPPLQRSPAATVRVLRRWLRAAHKLVHLARLLRQLNAARQDSYQRAGPKATRPWPAKKQSKPPGLPVARNAADSQVKQAAKHKTPRHEK